RVSDSSAIGSYIPRGSFSSVVPLSVSPLCNPSLIVSSAPASAPPPLSPSELRAEQKGVCLAIALSFSPSLASHPSSPAPPSLDSGTDLLSLVRSMQRTFGQEFQNRIAAQLTRS